MKIVRWLIFLLILEYFFIIGNAETKPTSIIPKGYKPVVEAFHKLQSAMKKKDPGAMYDILPKNAPIPREQYIARFQKMDQRLWEIDIFKIISDGEIIRVEPLKVSPGSEFAGYCKVWLKWEAGKRLGSELFVKEDNEWKWAPRSGDEPRITHPFYDKQTPIQAFLSLKQAMDLKDNLAFYNALADNLRIQVSFEDYEGFINKKRKEHAGEVPSFSYNVDDLEEEMLEAKDKKPHSKVWKLKKENKKDSRRIGFELFIKEGEEWKWIPKKEYIWYPDNEKKE